jgi:hypothetical protein
MSCSNCYNGCSEIVSDKCVKYTGVDVPILGIKNGDSLSYVEQALITFLTSTLDGSGIIIPLPESLEICEVVSKYIPECSELTPPILFEVLIKAACDIQSQLDVVKSTLGSIVTGYDVDCLQGVDEDSSIKQVLQAVIDKLCTLSDDFDGFQIDVETNYVKLSDLNDLIQAYLDSITPVMDQQYKKMVPFTVVEYYGPLSNFDGTGKGILALGWDKVYLCNGLNSTPDKRGRLAVGAISTVPGPALDPAVAPGTFNPNYTLGYTTGTNFFAITNSNQLPPHTHNSTATVSFPPHRHKFSDDSNNPTDPLRTGNDIIVSGSGTAAISGTNTGSGRIYETSATALTTTITPTITTTGSSSPIGHIPPVLACYYIMYIP